MGTRAPTGSMGLGRMNVPSDASDLRVMIVLPDPGLGGVRMWAERTSERLAARGARVMLVVHGTFGARANARYRVEELRVAPPRDNDAASRHDASVSYARLLTDSWWGRGPVVVCPQLTGACYQACIAAAHDALPAHRVGAWLHSDFAYDYALMRAFEGSLGGFACVGRTIAERLRTVLPARADDIRLVPHGVTAGESRADDDNADDDNRVHPLRLLYTGRLDLADKRSGALPAMSEALTHRGVPHELRIVGDGPARRHLVQRCDDLPSVDLREPTDDVTPHLEWCDAFVLPSRREGAGLSLLEAMAHARPGVATHTAAGAREMIEASGGGVIATVDEHADDGATGIALADAVVGLVALGLGGAGRRAHEWARRERSPDGSTNATIAALRAVARSPDRPIPSKGVDAGRPWTVPPDATARVAALIIDGVATGLWGAGAHSDVVVRQLGSSERRSILGVIDDDPARAGGALHGLPIVGPSGVGSLGVRRVVISSWVHEADMWARRGWLEAMGIEVVRLYSGGPLSGRGSGSPAHALLSSPSRGV